MSLFHLYVLVSHSYNIHMYLYVIRISLVCTCMSYECHSCALICHSYVTCISLVCIRMSFVCRWYVFACHLYVTRIGRMYSYTIRMSLVCISTMNLFCILHSSLILKKSYIFSKESFSYLFLHFRKWEPPHPPPKKKKNIYIYIYFRKRKP